jgi:hypothetical protein
MGGRLSSQGTPINTFGPIFDSCGPLSYSFPFPFPRKVPFFFPLLAWANQNSKWCLGILVHSFLEQDFGHQNDVLGIIHVLATIHKMNGGPLLEWSLWNIVLFILGSCQASKR